jgi:hypothetical protein
MQVQTRRHPEIHRSPDHDAARRRSSAARSASLPDSSIARLIATTGDAWNRASSAYGAAIYQVEAS